MRRIGAVLSLAMFPVISAAVHTLLSVAVQRVGRVVGTHEALPWTASGPGRSSADRYEWQDASGRGRRREIG